MAVQEQEAPKVLHIASHSYFLPDQEEGEEFYKTKYEGDARALPNVTLAREAVETVQQTAPTGILDRFEACCMFF